MCEPNLESVRDRQDHKTEYHHPYARSIPSYLSDGRTEAYARALPGGN